MFFREQFQTIYDEMKERNHSLLLTKGTQPDARLQSSKLDKRVSLSLFAFFPNKIEQNFHQVIHEAQQLFPDQIIYTPRPSQKVDTGLLHFTMFQLFKVNHLSHKVHKKSLTKYISFLQKFLSEMPTFSIQYSGLIALPTGVAAYGYPTIDLNEYRNDLRERLKRAGLDYIEPYKADIAHSTLVRLRGKQDPEKLIYFAKKYDGFDLGKLSVNKVRLALGSWRMWPRECRVFKTFQLGS